MLCNMTIPALYRDPDPQRQHLQSSWYPWTPCWSLHPSAANHAQPLVFSRQSASSLPKHLKAIFLLHCFIVSPRWVTQTMMTKSIVVLTGVIRKQKRTQWQRERALPARGTAMERAPGEGQTGQLLGYKPEKRPRWHQDVYRIPLSSFQRA